ncbi:hypothetical protein [Micromonospora chalcea]|uniref:hypothetical protein n=1 Tax=Micromonospora chalcea TaxID=1874 RepID=UPI003D740A07
MPKPRVTTNCVANGYAGPDERIVEVSGQRGKGCLISIRNRPDGTVSIDVHRRDPEVVVNVADPES